MQAHVESSGMNEDPPTGTRSVMRGGPRCELKAPTTRCHKPGGWNHRLFLSTLGPGACRLALLRAEAPPAASGGLLALQTRHPGLCLRVHVASPYICVQSPSAFRSENSVSGFGAVS